MIERSILMLLVVGLLIGVLAVVKRARAGGRALLLLSIVIVLLPTLLFAPHLADQMVRARNVCRHVSRRHPSSQPRSKSCRSFGRRLGAAWDRVVEVKGNLRALLEPYIANLEQLMTGAARGLAHSLVQVLLSLIVATMFWTNGDGPVSVLHDALRRLGVRSPSTRSTLPPARYAASPTA